MSYNFNYSYGNDHPESNYGRRTISDLSGNNYGNADENIGVGYSRQTQPLSALLNAPSQSSTQRFTPAYEQQFGNGTVYKSDPNSTTEYYSGNDPQSFYAQYMARMGFGNMEGNSLPDDRR